MKAKYIFLFLCILITATPVLPQTFSLTDSATVFKDQEGKILSKEEAEEQMKGSFSIHKENINGKQVITIMSSAGNDSAKRNAMVEAFRENLINKPIEDFRLPGLYYQVWDSKQLRGRVLVINFWSRACDPCIKEMPVLNELTALYQVKNVVFLAPAPENKNKVKRFLKKNIFNYNIIPAATSYIKSMDIGSYPTQLIIDKKGIIRQVFIGYDDNTKKKLQSEIDKLLKERR